MRDNLTELVFILDRSGSMASMKEEAIGGFNAFLEEQQKLEGEANLTLVLFDNEYKKLYDGVDIKKCATLNENTYVPRGTTALLDAIGRTMNDVGQRLASMAETERPSKVLVAVLTDGMENASQDYQKAKINEMITHQTDKYSWQFLFLGANQDAIGEGMSLGISAKHSMTYDFNKIGTKHAFATLSNSVKSYRTTGTLDDLTEGN